MASLLTLEGGTELMARMFSSASPAPLAFYIAPIAAAGFTGIADTDTMGSHGWVEETGDTESTRVPLVGLTLAVQGPPPKITMGRVGWAWPSEVGLRGFFIVSSGVATKGDNTGKLWAVVDFEAEVWVTSIDSLDVLDLLFHSESP